MNKKGKKAKAKKVILALIYGLNFDEHVLSGIKVFCENTYLVKTIILITGRKKQI